VSEKIKRGAEFFKKRISSNPEAFIYYNTTKNKYILCLDSSIHKIPRLSFTTKEKAIEFRDKLLDKMPFGKTLADILPWEKIEDKQVKKTLIDRVKKETIQEIEVIKNVIKKLETEIILLKTSLKGRR
jgi:hypothetical protein